MRKLKTPEEICEEFPFEEPITPELLTKIIKSAQRDALECAAETATMKCVEATDGHLTEAVEVDKSSILNLMPKP